MKIELFDMNEFIELNNVKEVTSGVLFERGGIPNPDGLISDEIFGVNVKSRRNTFAYIDLGGHFFTPHIYKAIRRVFRNIDKIINGERYYSISKEDGRLIEDPSGDTGIDFLYNNWNKIKWYGNEGMSSERTNLISKTPKSQVFVDKWLVIPAFYRDVKTSKKGGGETGELNNYYAKVIRMSGLLKDKDMYDFAFHGTNYTIQGLLVDIYNYLKDRLDKKRGLLRKYLLGKNVDLCVRSVITAPIYNCDDPRDNIVSLQYSAIPISHICTMCYPFIVSWVRNFFERELIENKSIKWSYNLDSKENEDFVEVKDPEGYYTDTLIKKMINRYIKDPSCRYDKIFVPTTDDKPHYLIFQGRYVNKEEESAGIANRYMTWTDLLFLACDDVVKDKHVMVTRYPILDNFGIFFCRIRVASTMNTMPVEINGKVYKWYPVIDLDTPKHEIAKAFIDSMRFSNSYLKGLDGDYDGDQVTEKILWTQEANAEAEKYMSRKSFILNQNGKNTRTTDLESIQTLYVLTKEPYRGKTTATK